MRLILLDINSIRTVVMEHCCLRGAAEAEKLLYREKETPRPTSTRECQ